VKRRELGDACDDLCNAFFNRSDEIASRFDRSDIDENHLFAEMVPEIIKQATNSPCEPCLG
jgi:hypothetical protein